MISLREETAKRRRHDAMRSSVHSRAGVIVLTGGKLTMGFFDFLKGPDINQGIAEYRGTQGAVLLDVRTAQEYRGGHIPGSKNIPLQSLGRAGDFAGSPSTPIFVYCQSGSRSRHAAGILNKMGYTNVKNLGGIAAYRGKVEY